MPIQRKINDSLALTTISLNEQVEQFSKVEELQSNETFYSKEDSKCKEYFTQNTYRDVTRRFVVSIPLKEKIDLGNSKELSSAN